MKNHNILLCIIIAFLAFSIIIIYSSSYYTAEASANFNDGFWFLRKHLVWIIISLVILMITKSIPYQFWSRIDWFILGFILALLVLVLIPGIGTAYSGARRWFRFGGIGFQPSELAKLGLVIFLAGFISKDPQRIKYFISGLLPLVLIIGLTCGLVILEPDIGTACFIALLSVIILVVSGIKLWHLAPIAAGVIPLVAYFVIHKFAYVQQRLAVFFNPALYSDSAAGYQIKQSLIGLGAGGFWGNGLGASKQKLFFLPQQQSDFIFAIIGEELGFIGALGIILLFGLFLWQARKVVLRAPDLFGSLLAFGITLMVILQAIINIGVVTASLPTKGIALPFISFGGSSLCTLMIGIGILLNIAAQSDLSADPE